MANLALRLPENVPGDFYVDSTCIDCDACRHQLRGLFVSHSSAHCRELAAAVDASNLFRIRDDYGFDAASLPAEDRHQVRKVVLALRVLGRDAAHRIEETIQRERVNAGVDLPDGLLLPLPDLW